MFLTTIALKFEDVRNPLVSSEEVFCMALFSKSNIEGHKLIILYNLLNITGGGLNAQHPFVAFHYLLSMLQLPPGDPFLFVRFSDYQQQN